MAQFIRIDVDEVEDELGEAVQQILRDIGIEFVNFVKMEAPVGATEDLRRSWQILEQRPGEITIGSNVPYAGDVNDGTDPHLADIEPLLVWARRVLGSESAGYAVWQKIAREGTEPNPYIDRSIDRTIDKVTS